MADDSTPVDSSTPDSTIGQPYIDAIKRFEGYSPKAQWDYHQWSNGYGTRALYPGEQIDQSTAEQRLRSEVNKSAAAVDSFAPGAPAGAREALIDLTYNSGRAWTSGSLGQAVRNGDWPTAQQLIIQYNHAGGKVLDSLTSRRAENASWFTSPLNDSPGAPASPGGIPPSQGTPGGPGGVAKSVPDKPNALMQEAQQLMQPPQIHQAQFPQLAMRLRGAMGGRQQQMPSDVAQRVADLIKGMGGQS